MKRAGFLATSSASAIVLGQRPGEIAAAESAAPSTAPATVPITGPAVPELASIDRFMTSFMSTWKVTGGVAAAAKDGRLVYARGFGYVDQQRPGKLAPAQVQPSARFRIASSSKPFTAVAVMRLVELGRIHLDELAFSILSDFKPPAGSHPDPRLRTITVRHLLEHSGGFVTGDFDPQFDALRLAAAVFGKPAPATATDIIRYMMGKPLGFTPGTKYSYSNLGYNILGRIIERRTHMAYGAAIEALVLKPAGIHGMRLMTRTSPDARLPDEVSYVDGDQYLPGYSVYADDPFVRAYSYGGFDGRAIDAHGGWIASASDLVRFVNAVAGTSGTQILRPATVEQMLARPSIPSVKDQARYYALGWDVTPAEIVCAHNGAITFGTLSTLVRLPHGVTYAMAFNHLDADIGHQLAELVTRSAEAVRAVTTWP